MTPAATKLIATIILFFISSSSISYFNYSLLKLAELDASVTRKYDKCHKNSVQNKQDTLYNKTQVEKSKAASSKEISNPIHTILKTNTYLKSKERKFLSHKHIHYMQNKKLFNYFLKSL